VFGFDLKIMFLDPSSFRVQRTTFL